MRNFVQIKDWTTIMLTLTDGAAAVKYTVIGNDNTGLELRPDADPTKRIFVPSTAILTIEKVQ
jgi:hypothetical protein